MKCFSLKTCDLLWQELCINMTTIGTFTLTTFFPNGKKSFRLKNLIIRLKNVSVYINANNANRLICAFVLYVIRFKLN